MRLTPAVRWPPSAIEIFGETPVAAHLDGTQIIAAAARGRRRRDPSGLWLPVRECRLRPRGRRGGPDLRRPGRRGHRADGRQDLGRAISLRSARLSGRAVGDRGRRSRRPSSERARAVGFPLLIKAGGRRRRQGHAHRARRRRSRRRDRSARAAKAQRYFGDGRLYVERYVERPRHIEVQVLGDGTAMSCICSSANARCSAASRRSSRRRRRRALGDSAARADLRRRGRLARAADYNECRHGRVHLRRAATSSSSK